LKLFADIDCSSSERNENIYQTFNEKVKGIEEKNLKKNKYDIMAKILKSHNRRISFVKSEKKKQEEHKMEEEKKMVAEPSFLKEIEEFKKHIDIS